MKIDLHHI